MRQPYSKTPDVKKTTFPTIFLRSQNEDFKRFIRRLVDKINTLEDNASKCQNNRKCVLAFFQMETETATVNLICRQKAQYPTLDANTILQSDVQEKGIKSNIIELKKLLDSCTESNYRQKEGLLDAQENTNQFRK